MSNGQGGWMRSEAENPLVNQSPIFQPHEKDSALLPGLIQPLFRLFLPPRVSPKASPRSLNEHSRSCSLLVETARSMDLAKPVARSLCGEPSYIVH